MSKKQWLALLMLFLFYLLLGAWIFWMIESKEEETKLKIAQKERIEISRLLHKHYVSNGNHSQHEIFEKLSKYCNKPVHNYSAGENDRHSWTFYNSFYFAYTVVSTIGYGNLAPTTPLSRMLMIVYALVGIPINGILLAQLGEFFGQTFVTAVKKYKNYKQNQNDYSKKSLSSLENKRRFGLAIQILTYLIPGFVMFIFFPAALFTYFESWCYHDSVYYAFVTLTTIGFGDYVAGQDYTKYGSNDVWFKLYQGFLIVWISFGLGYIVMIMTFIGRGYTSKKIARFEHKLAAKIKHTQSKIWNEVNEDMNYLRRVFNELQFYKVKTVYVDEYDYYTPPSHFPRSKSFPDIRELVYGGLEPPSPPQPRRRANSEVVPVEAQVARVVSETDLQRIDKRATFATHAMVQPAELLARLVNILGYMPPQPDDDELEPADNTCTTGGFELFSEKEILASEAGPWDPTPTDPVRWKLGGDSPKPCRSRAASEVRLDHPSQYLQPSACEWTWSGPAASNKIQELMRARKNTVIPETSGKDGKSRFLGLPSKKALLPRWVRLLKKDQPTAQDVEAQGIDNEVFEPESQVPGGRKSQPAAATSAETDSYSGTHLTYPAGSNLLEETSLADFIRALTALHSRVGAMPDDFKKGQTIGPQQPQRKLGTASLTPPKLSSLLTLFSPPPGHSQSHQNTVTSAVTAAPPTRRFSLRTAESSSTSTPVYQRRTKLSRRFSLRPVVNLPSRQYYPQSPDDRQPSSSPPPYSSEPFDCPKKPLVQMESALGVSTPVAHQHLTSSTGRRFSLRPAQIGVPPEPASRQPVSRVVPRWKAGLLQRQIAGKAAHRRVRAFSLSDVNEESDRRIGISPLALHDNARTVTSVQSQGLAKTVTIVSPEQQEAGRNPFVRRYNSDIESVSSRSSSSLDRASDKQLEPEDYKWDFDDAPQEQALAAMVQESEAKKEEQGRMVHLKKRKDDEEPASATRKPSIASIEPWSSHSRKTSRQEEDKTEVTGRFSIDKPR